MSKERIGSSLSGAEFKRGMLHDLEQAEVLREFGGAGLVTEVLEVIGDGKEATVYRCRADPSTGVEYLAAKVYRAQKFRAFAGARVYAGERGSLDARAARAMRTKTRTGRRMAHHEWIAWEWETLCRLHDAGADVPNPLASTDDAILMEYVGDGDGAAPQLRHVELELPQARTLLERLLRNVELFLDCHLVHGDLSAYNVLWFDDRPWIIDVPQSVDLHSNRDGFHHLCRDVRNLERYFAPHGLSARDFARRAWARYLRGELGR
jgi:RIO kinase 1